LLISRVNGRTYPYVGPPLLQPFYGRVE